ncbi:MAG: hypothetical protein JWN46_253, partial [Acidimicrobiales bacterium]|nr:hypothetical protein [Acidimicrobiales bacterium]
MARLRPLGCALVFGLVGAGVATTAGAPAASAAPTVTYTLPGSYLFRVPQGVTSIGFQVAGAEGGHESQPGTKPGGLGGEMDAQFTVTPCETLQISVGGKGGSVPTQAPPVSGGVGGYNGGADGGSGTFGGGGGGGASDVRRGGYQLTNRIVVGGGGGGGGETFLGVRGGGAGGGPSGGDGSNGSGALPAAGGKGATSASGGAG